MIPQNIGRYDVKSELGRGGMATVYLGYDPRFRRDVAIKVLPREFLHDPQFRARFEREAQTIAMLDHPAIVPVFDFGEEDGLPYLVMRCMTGGSLATQLKRGPLALVEAARIFSRLAPALDEAHARGIIHRDLKPGNILFDQRNDPYLSDFGIVKLSESSAAFTGSGLIGTPAYMSPEQVRGEKTIDGRSDIYALGVILFEILTGKQPFEATTPIGVAFKHVTDPVPRVLEFKPDLPLDAQAVIERAMAKAPDERFQTAGAMAEGLQSLAHGQPLTRTRSRAEPPPTLRAEPVPTAVAALPETREAVAAPTEPAPTSAQPIPDEALARARLTLESIAEPAREAQAAPPPEQRPAPVSTTPTVAMRPANRRLLWLAAGAAGIVVIAVIAALNWPNGLAAGVGQTATAEALARATAQALAAMEKPAETVTPIRRAPTSTSGSQTRPSTPTATVVPATATLTPVPPTPTLAPTPTDSVPVGRHVMQVYVDASTGNNDIYVVHSDGSVVNVTDANGDDHDPALSPDGKWIAFASKRTGNDEVYVIKNDGTGLTNLTNRRTQDNGPVWSPDGRQIAFVSEGDLYVMNVDGSLQVRLTNVSGVTNEYPCHSVWSPDGSRVAVSTTAGIYAVKADGTGQTRLSQMRGSGLTWSPDGTQVSFSFGPSAGGNYTSLFVAETNTLETIGLGGYKAYNWSPDGTQIAFVSRREGGDEIYVSNLDHSEPVRLTRLTIDYLAQNTYPVWSPDGLHIAFGVDRDANLYNDALYVVDVNSSETVNLTNEFYVVSVLFWSGLFDQFSWSPDSQRIVFASNRDRNSEIYSVEIDGSGLTNLTNNSASDDLPVWLQDGRILFRSDRDGKPRYYTMNPDGTNVQPY